MNKLLERGATEDKGENARLQAYVGAIAIGDLIKTTLGPMGMDKILQGVHRSGPGSESVTVTNDGATILSSLWLDNAAAKILVDVSRTQDQQYGDGTSSVVVLAAELLRNAETLVMHARIHPMIIIRGYRIALDEAMNCLKEMAWDPHADENNFRSELKSIALTTLSSKLLTHEKEIFADLALEAVWRLYRASTTGHILPLDHIQVIKKTGGSLSSSYLADGFILEKRIGVGMAKSIKNCKVLVANTPMDTDRIKFYGARVSTTSLAGVRDIEICEKEKMKKKVEKICSHGCNVFINRQLIYNYPEQVFKANGVVAIEHSDFDGTERLSAVLGADIVSTFDDPGNVKLGYCAEIKEIMIGEDKVIHFSGCAQSGACSIVIRGSSQHVLDEADRSLHDALAVLHQTLSKTEVVCGGGCCEAAMAVKLDRLAQEVSGKESLAISGFSKALMAIPTALAENAGLDATELTIKLRANHSSQSLCSNGLDINLGIIGDMKSLGIRESYASKLSQLRAATEAAEMIIRVDDILTNAPRERGKP